MKKHTIRDPSAVKIQRAIYITSQMYTQINEWIERAWRAGAYGDSKGRRGKKPSFAQWGCEAIEQRFRREFRGPGLKREIDPQLKALADEFDRGIAAEGLVPAVGGGKGAGDTGSEQGEAPGAADGVSEDEPRYVYGGERGETLELLDEPFDSMDDPRIEHPTVDDGPPPSMLEDLDQTTVANDVNNQEDVI